MPFVSSNGIRMAYQSAGDGPPVVLIMGSSASGRAWTAHQTPALNRAGYRTVTFDNRGIAPSDAPAGRYSLHDMVADTAGLIEAVVGGPCRLVGTSLGAMIAQELALHRPDLVTCAVLLATRARADAVRLALTIGDQALAESGITLPPAYAASAAVTRMFSPSTLNDDAAATIWLEAFELTTGVAAPGQAWADIVDNRCAALRGIDVPCRVIAFADDLLTPPHLGAEVADAIPNCDFITIAAAGHLGFMERPDEVNAAITEFLDKTGPHPRIDGVAP